MGGATGTDRVEIATFYIGDAWFGVAATSVVEAISVKGLTKIPGANECLAGTILFRDDVIPVLMPHAELEVEVDLHNENAQIVVTQSDSGKVGIIVDRLGEIPEVSHDQINSEHNWWKGDDSYIESFIKPPPESDWEGLLVVLDPTRLLQSRLLARGVSISNILGEQNDGVSAELHDAVESGSAIG
jgi:chemotaxis signal transduction protein